MDCLYDNSGSIDRVHYNFDSCQTMCDIVIKCANGITLHYSKFILAKFTKYDLGCDILYIPENSHVVASMLALMLNSRWPMYDPCTFADVIVYLFKVDNTMLLPIALKFMIGHKDPKGIRRCIEKIIAGEYRVMIYAADILNVYTWVVSNMTLELPILELVYASNAEQVLCAYKKITNKNVKGLWKYIAKTGRRIINDPKLAHVCSIILNDGSKHCDMKMMRPVRKLIDAAGTSSEDVPLRRRRSLTKYTTRSKRNSRVKIS